MGAHERLRGTRATPADQLDRSESAQVAASRSDRQPIKIDEAHRASAIEHRLIRREIAVQQHVRSAVCRQRAEHPLPHTVERGYEVRHHRVSAVPGRCERTSRIDPGQPGLRQVRHSTQRGMQSGDGLPRALEGERRLMSRSGDGQQPFQVSSRGPGLLESCPRAAGRQDGDTRRVQRCQEVRRGRGRVPVPHDRGRSVFTTRAGPARRLPAQHEAPPRVVAEHRAADGTGRIDESTAAQPLAEVAVQPHRPRLQAQALVPGHVRVDQRQSGQETLRALGAEVVEAAPDLRDADRVFLTTRAYDFAASYGDLVRERGAEIKATMRENVEDGLGLGVDDLFANDAARARLHQATTAFFRDVDVLVTPAVQVLPFDAELEFPTSVAGTPTPHYLDWMRAATLISATGLPSLSVPGGFSAGGLPVGLQMVTADQADGLLLDVAQTFEEATRFADVRPQLGAAAGAGVPQAVGV